MKKNLRKVFAVSMAGAMVAGCIPAMADEAASTTNWEPFAETVTLRVPVYDPEVQKVFRMFPTTIGPAGFRRILEISTTLRLSMFRLQEVML